MHTHTNAHTHTPRTHAHTHCTNAHTHAHTHAFIQTSEFSKDKNRAYYELILDLSEGVESLKRCLCPRNDEFLHFDMQTSSELIKIFRELGKTQFESSRQRVKEWARLQAARTDKWRYKPEVNAIIKRLMDGIDVPAMVVAIQVRALTVTPNIITIYAQIL